MGSPTRDPNSKVQLERPTRKSNSKVQLESPTRNPNSKSQLEIPTRYLVCLTQNSLAYILKIIGTETKAALEMLRCVVQGFNQLNIILLQNTETMVVIWCRMHM